MLANTVKEHLHTNALVVVIGARGTGKSYCGDQLQELWEGLNIDVLRLDAGTASNSEDLDGPLGEALHCEPSTLHSRDLPEDKVVRIIVDRCESLYDCSWFSAMQERWRSLLSDRHSEGRLAAVLLGRPLFRQIAGGDASPLLNLGPVITTQPWTTTDIASIFGSSESCAKAVWRKTGGHQKLTADLLEATDRDVARLGSVMETFLSGNHSYIARMIQDFPLEGRGVLVDLLEAQSEMEQTLLIERHFGSSHARGLEAIEDLCGAGLVKCGDDDRCHVSAELLRSVGGLKGFAKVRTLEIPRYDAQAAGSAQRALFFAENRLREVIAGALHRIDAMWWLHRVHPETRAAAESRQTGEAAVLGTEQAEGHPITYMSLGELFNLVLEGRNWNEVFRSVFSVGESTVKEDSARLCSIRNRLAHSRPIDERQVREVEQIVERLRLGAEDSRKS